MGSIKTISIIVAANIKGLETSMKKADKSLSGFASRATRLGSMMSFGVTAPLTALGKSAFDTFSQFENSMMKVNTVTGATVEEFASLTASAKRLGSTTQFTASQVSELQLVLGRKGFDPTQIEGMEAAILDLALATGEDLTLAADTVGASLNAFNLDAKESGRVANVLASAAANSSIQLSTFSTAFGHAGASANAVGVEVEELSAMMGVLMDNGIKASKAGTGLRKVFVELNERGIPFGETLEHLASGQMSLNKASKLVGKTAANQLMILAKNQQKVKELTSEYKNNTGRLDEMAKAMGDTTFAKVKKLESAIEGMKLEIGALIAEFITPLIKKITNWAAMFSNLDSKTKSLILTIAGIAALVGPILLVSGAFVSLGAALLPIIILSGKIILIMAAIGAAIYLVMNVLEGLGRLFSAIVTHISDNLMALRQRFYNFSARIKNFFIKAFTEAIKWLDKLAQKVGITWFETKDEPLLNVIIPDEQLNKFTEWSDSVEKSGKKVDNLKSSIKGFFSELIDGVMPDFSFGGTEAEVEFIGVDKALDDIRDLEDELEEEDLGIKVKTKFDWNQLSTDLGRVGEKIGEFADTWGTQITSVFDTIGQAFDNQMIKLDNYYTKEQEAIENSNMSQEQKAAAMEKLDEKVAEKRKKIQRKQAVADKAAAIIQATINGAQAITKVAAQTGIGAVAAAPIMSALVAAQIAMIAASPIPAFADGGRPPVGRVSLVGERGPELFVPGSSGTIIPNHMLGGGGGTVIPDVRITGDDLLLVFDKASRRRDRR